MTWTAYYQYSGSQKYCMMDRLIVMRMKLRYQPHCLALLIPSQCFCCFTETVLLLFKFLWPASCAMCVDAMGSTLYWKWRPRKRRPKDPRPTKMKTPYKNKDPLRIRRLPTKMKTPFGSIENEDPENEDLHVWKRRPTCMKTKTPYENQDPFITQAVKPGFSCQTSIYIFSKQKIVCPSNRTLIGHGLPSVFQLQNVYARQCVDASVGLCTRHNLCRTDHIEIYRPSTDCLQWGASLSGRGLAWSS